MLMKIHPLAQVLPKMNELEMAALKVSIQKSGLLVPILVLDNEILDGRHRYWACKEIGIEPKTVAWIGATDSASLLNCIVALNLSRRNLTISQRSAIAVNALEAYESEARTRQATSTGGHRPQLKQVVAEAGKGEARQFAARAFGVNRTYVSGAKIVKERRPDVFDELLNGHVSMVEALRIVKNQNAKPTKAIRLPKLSLPAEADRVFCIWGDQQQIDTFRALAGEHCIPYLEAERHASKWINKAEPAALL